MVTILAIICLTLTPCSRYGYDKVHAFTSVNLQAWKEWGAHKGWAGWPELDSGSPFLTHFEGGQGRRGAPGKIPFVKWCLLNYGSSLCLLKGYRQLKDFNQGVTL